MKFAIVIEQSGTNHSAYAPDLPGCVSTGGTIEEVRENIREAVVFHIDGMREDGDAVPLASSRVTYIRIES